MKKNLIIAAIAVSLLFACNKKQGGQVGEPAVATDSVVATQDSVAVATNEIIPPVEITDKDGKKMEISFDNNKQTATIKRNGETIELKQEVSGSGIVYKNDHYEYNEHQGGIILSKDGKEIFHHLESKKK